MARRTYAAVGIVLCVALLAVVYLVLHSRTERNAAEAQVARLRHHVVGLEGELESSRQMTQVLLGQANDTHTLVEGLRGQVEWDKSHLLDCWTAIVRILPVESMPQTVRGSRSAARAGSTLDQYVSNCASDAVP